MKNCYLLLVIFLFFFSVLNSATWIRYYGGDGEDVGYCVAQDLDGYYIVVGYTNSYGMGNKDIYVLKIDSLGDTIWTKTYGTSGDDIAYDLEITAINDYVICGQVNSGPCYVMKIDTGGNLIWDKTYSAFPKATSIISTFDNCFVIAGNGLLVKVDSMGDTLWSYYDNQPYPWWFDKCTVDETIDSCYLTTQGDDSNGLIIVNKFNRFGYLLDSFYIGYLSYYKCPIIALDDKGFIITGTTDQMMVSPAFVIRCDSLGNIIWGGYEDLNKSFLNPLPDHVDHYTDITLNYNNNIVGCGFNTNYSYLWDSYIFEIQYDSGSGLWSRSFGGGIVFYSIHVTNDKGYITCGYAPYQQEKNIILMKTDSLGYNAMEEPGITINEPNINTINFNQISNTFNIDLSTNTNLHLKIYDINGRIISSFHEGLLSSDQHQIPFTSAPGVYFFSLETDTDVFKGKFTVIR
ncbi:MAG: hypothetical protein APR63_11625 [Desulfuromonas sp. SDB]|nr:MAG: hypothetical protein APR63_11625 [Desulfuromonas sp. SDB]